MEYNQQWVSDIEQAIKNGSREKRVDSLRKVTNLFLSSAEHFNDNQIDVFDNVLCKLIDRIETRALAELSNKIAPVPNAPNEVIQRLARTDEITVAGPVLAQSKLLSTADHRDCEQQGPAASAGHFVPPASQGRNHRRPDPPRHAGSARQPDEEQDRADFGRRFFGAD